MNDEVDSDSVKSGAVVGLAEAVEAVGFVESAEVVESDEWIEAAPVHVAVFEDLVLEVEEVAAAAVEEHIVAVAGVDYIALRVEACAEQGGIEVVQLDIGPAEPELVSELRSLLDSSSFCSAELL